MSLSDWNTIIPQERLYPAARGPFVLPRYYGGPCDGLVEHSVCSSDVMGSLRRTGGRYEFQGFMSGFAPPSLEQFAIEFAVYEWVSGQ
jgi:hypothetical protein